MLVAREYESAATMAWTTISGVTANGMLWMVSPGTVAALATVASSSLLIPSRPRSERVVGRPTLMQNAAMVCSLACPRTASG